MLKQKVTSFLD